MMRKFALRFRPRDFTTYNQIVPWNLLARHIMQLEDYFDFLADNDIRVKGTRIGIETILYEHLHGSQSPQAIATRYPSLRLEQVYATITYYLHNEDAVRRYLADWIEHGRRMRDEQAKKPSSAVTRLRNLKAERQIAGSPGDSSG